MSVTSSHPVILCTAQQHKFTRFHRVLRRLVTHTNALSRFPVFPSQHRVSLQTIILFQSSSTCLCLITSAIPFVSNCLARVCFRSKRSSRASVVRERTCERREAVGQRLGGCPESQGGYCTPHPTVSTTCRSGTAPFSIREHFTANTPHDAHVYSPSSPPPDIRRGLAPLRTGRRQPPAAIRT